MRVVMVGATGRYAGYVLDELLRRKVWVRALVRDRATAAAARKRGAHDAVVADLRLPDTLTAAVAGMDGAFHIGPGLSADEAAMGTALIGAARVAGVAKVVFSGVIHPAISALSNHTAKLAVEDALYSSGLNFTVLQPARFMQTLSSYWEPGSDRLTLPYAVTSKMSWVDYRDVAEVAAAALTGDQLGYGTFELSSVGILDGTQIASILSGVVGRRVTAVQIPAEHYARGLPTYQRPAFLQMMRYYDRVGLPAGNDVVLRTLLGREPRSIHDFLAELHNSHSNPEN